MRITDIPSVTKLLSRMESLSQMAENPEAMVSFPELVEKSLKSQSKTETLGVDPNANLPKASFDTQSFLPSGEGLGQNNVKLNGNMEAGGGQGGILGTIERIAREKGMDPNLVKAIVKAESNFKPNAVSPKGAMGLMQLMPKTAEALGVDAPFDPEENITGGVTYLKDLFKEFKDPTKAIAAYNAGPGAVKKYGTVPPYAETQKYVEKVKKYYKEY